MDKKEKLPIRLALPEGFLEEEVRCDYLISADMKAVWAVELDLVNEFQRVCREYGIQYFADSGTLLGAVRHQGFIPWDDDIDIMMMRDQYDRLCSVADKAFSFPYFFQTEYSDPGTLRGHAQLRNSLTTGILKEDFEKGRTFNQGIFIDIFPLDAIPDHEEEYQLKLQRTGSELGRARRVASLQGAASLFRFPLFYDYFYRRYEKECRKGNDVRTEKVTKYYSALLAKRQIWYREDFESSTDSAFEMLTIPVPAGYRRILDIFYGPDWMTPQRANSAHGGVLFDPVKPYTEYLEQGKWQEK